MRRLSILVALIATFALAGTALGASTTWKLYSFNTSGSHLQANAATVNATTGAASFTFPTSTFTGAAYLLTAKAPTGLAPLSATVSIADADAGTTFTNWPGCANNINIPTVGLYFETKTSGTLNPSAYWWSSDRHLLSEVFVAGTSGVSLTRNLYDGSQWTNYYGQAGNSTSPYTVNGVNYPAPNTYFAAAVAKVTAWGVTFGGDCFYANGVAASNSSAVFTLQP